MKGALMFLGVVGAGAALAGLAIAASKDDETEPAPAPPVGRFPARPAPSLPAIPPSSIQIPGGTYIDNVGWCPPGYIYDYASNMCTPMIITPLPPGVTVNLTAGAKTGACCASCAAGEECEGC